MRVWGCEDMDPRDRADAVLARAQARNGVVTPDNMTSPMDSANTQKIPRSVVSGLDADPDTTTKLPSSVIAANDAARGDSHLADAAQTTPLTRPSSDQAAQEQASVTQPVRISSPDGESTAEQPRPDSGGLVPTTTPTSEPAPQSYVARRLEGL